MLLCQPPLSPPHNLRESRDSRVINTGVLAVLTLPSRPSEARAALVGEGVAAQTAIAAANIGGQGARVLYVHLDRSPPAPAGVIPSLSRVFSLRPNSKRANLSQFIAVVDAHTGKLTYVWYAGWIVKIGSVKGEWPLLYLRTLPQTDVFAANFLLYKPTIPAQISRSAALHLFRSTRIGRKAQIAEVWSTNWGAAQGHVLDWIIAASIPGGRWTGEFASPYIYTLVDAQTGDVIPILACGNQPAWH